MSNTRTSFIEKVLFGSALMQDIDDYVEEWHQGNGSETLAKFLGMTDEEYSLWITSPGTIGLIVSARHDDRSIIDAANDNFEKLKLAARAMNTPEIARLQVWLRKLGKIS